MGAEGGGLPCRSGAREMEGGDPFTHVEGRRSNLIGSAREVKTFIIAARGVRCHLQRTRQAAGDCVHSLTHTRIHTCKGRTSASMCVSHNVRVHACVLKAIARRSCISRASTETRPPARLTTWPPWTWTRNLHPTAR